MLLLVTLHGPQCPVLAAEHTDMGVLTLTRTQGAAVGAMLFESTLDALLFPWMLLFLLRDKSLLSAAEADGSQQQ